MKGLFGGGLRIGESLLLDWEDDTHLCVDINRRMPMFKIQATNDKGGKYRMLPMAPEFAELLKTVPAEERVGRVFKLPGNRTEGFNGEDRVKHVLCDIGAVSGVKVSESNSQPKFASAHDLRRAFGVRWSQRVLPPVLTELMRHADIHATMQFYVGRNAERSASEAWAAYEKSNSNKLRSELAL